MLRDSSDRLYNIMTHKKLPPSESSSLPASTGTDGVSARRNSLSALLNFSTSRRSSFSNTTDIEKNSGAFNNNTNNNNNTFEDFSTFDYSTRVTASGKIARWIWDSRSRIFVTFLFSAIVAFLLGYTVYLAERNHNPAFEAVGWSIPIARSTGRTLCFVFAAQLLPMCRNLVGLLHNYRFFQFIPLDSCISFHKKSGYLIALLSLIHCGAHWYNFYAISNSASSAINSLFGNGTLTHFIESTNSFKTFSFVELCFKTLPGLTGHLILLSMLIMIPPAIFLTRKYHNLFYISHWLFLPIYGLTLAHGQLALFASPVFQWFIIVSLFSWFWFWFWFQLTIFFLFFF